MKQPKIRIDQLLVERCMVETREKAKALLMAGEVFVDDKRVDKAGTAVPLSASIEIRGRGLPFASRGGFKLEKALDDFNVCTQGLVVADVGASTGGFTDCLLQRGSKKVYAIDVGYGLLSLKLRNDSRVTVMDKTNARYLKPDDFEELPDLVTIDVSFISLELILPAVASILAENGRVISLVKPQFEAGKGQVGKGGVVRDPAVHKAVIEKVLACAGMHSLNLTNLTFSPIRGPAGNIEFLAGFQKTSEKNRKLGEQAELADSPAQEASAQNAEAQDNHANASAISELAQQVVNQAWHELVEAKEGQ